MTVEAAEVVRTDMSFADGSKPVGISYGLNIYKNEVSYVTHEIDVTNARQPGLGIDLATHGFCLTEHRTAVTDFSDAAQQDYYKNEVKALIAELTGARKVIVFHMQLRDNSPTAKAGLRKPAFFAHIDYNEETFRIRAREELGAEADEWLARPFAAYNVWRGVKPVREKHLAVCDARTVRIEDFIETQVHEKPGHPTPYVGMPLTHNPAQRWFYFPRMQPEEALIFKQCDSDHGKPRWSPHVAIDDPHSDHGQPRISFEARTLAFF